MMHLEFSLLDFDYLIIFASIRNRPPAFHLTQTKTSVPQMVGAICMTKMLSNPFKRSSVSSEIEQYSLATERKLVETLIDMPGYAKTYITSISATFCSKSKKNESTKKRGRRRKDVVVYVGFVQK